jgi:hypothetical protein
MSVLENSRDADRLRQLYGLREQRALELIAEQRIELERVQVRLKEQQTLIQSLEAQLDDLRELRSGTGGKQITPETLRAESDRRQLLRQELDMEVFYLPGFNSDVQEATNELITRQRAWARIRDRLKGVEQKLDKEQINVLRRHSRRQDALTDDIGSVNRDPLREA